MPSLKRGSDEDLGEAIPGRKKPRGAETESETTSTKQHRVRFASACSVIEVPSRTCLTEEEFSDIYMTDEDQRRIYVEIATTIRGMKESEHSDLEKERILRGLEGVMEREENEAGSSERMKTAISAILDRQMLYDIDESWLSSYYRPYSEEAAALARDRAQRDEQENSALHPRNIVMQR
jgi:hypothetical protein